MTEIVPNLLHSGRIAHGVLGSREMAPGARSRREAWKQLRGGSFEDGPSMRLCRVRLWILEGAG